MQQLSTEDMGRALFESNERGRVLCGRRDRRRTWGGLSEDLRRWWRHLANEAIGYVLARVDLSDVSKS